MYWMVRHILLDLTPTGHDLVARLREKQGQEISILRSSMGSVQKLKNRGWRYGQGAYQDVRGLSRHPPELCAKNLNYAQKN